MTFKIATGAILSPPDSQDYIARSMIPGTTVPPFLDLRGKCQPVRNQGAEGTCVPHTVSSGVMGYFQTVKGFNRILNIRELYDDARAVSANNFRPISGEGAHMRDCLKAAFDWGICLETDVPYVPHTYYPEGPDTFKNKPLNKVGSYAAVTLNNPAIKVALNTYGPVAAVIDCRAGFANPTNGKASFTGDSYGLHAVTLVGYDDSVGCYILRNSWGSEWGTKGHTLLPYDYEIKEAWVITPSITAETYQPKPWWQWW